MRRARPIWATRSCADRRIVSRAGRPALGRLLFRRPGRHERAGHRLHQRHRDRCRSLLRGGPSIRPASPSTPLGNQDSTAHAFRRLRRLSTAMGRRGDRRRGHLQLASTSRMTATNAIAGGFGARPASNRPLRGGRHRRPRASSTTARCACAAAGRPACSCPTRRSASRSARMDITRSVVVTPPATDYDAARHRRARHRSRSARISTTSSATARRQASASTSA